jgi:hypothetical protein
VKEFGVYAVHDHSGVDGDGITSFAASEDLERVVKVIDVTPGVRKRQLRGRRIGGSTTQRVKLQRPRGDNPTSTERAAKLAEPDDP